MSRLNLSLAAEKKWAGTVPAREGVSSSRSHEAEPERVAPSMGAGRWTFGGARKKMAEGKPATSLSLSHARIETLPGRERQ